MGGGASPVGYEPRYGGRSLDFWGGGASIFLGGGASIWGEGPCRWRLFGLPSPDFSIFANAVATSDVLNYAKKCKR